jgi:Domain of unknown function (DUF4129)
MTRSIDELAAAVFDVISGPVLLLLLIVVAGVGGSLWYWYPAWVPQRLPRRARRVKPTKRPKEPAKAEPVLTAADPEPAVAVPEDLLLADRLAAEGRFAEAVRQRLRDIIRDLVVAGVIAPQPGWTAAELAATAAGQRPSLAWPLGAAVELFSEIWYGDRPAGRAQDDRMRTLTGQVRDELQVRR